MYFCVEFAEKIFPHLFFHCSIPSFNNTRLLLVISLRVAGVRKGRGRELGRETTREGGGRREPFFLSFLSPSRAPKFPLPLPLSTTATQAASLSVE